MFVVTDEFHSIICLVVFARAASSTNLIEYNKEKEIENEFASRSSFVNFE